jgi:hypothetical protein
MRRARSVAGCLGGLLVLVSAAAACSSASSGGSNPGGTNQGTGGAGQGGSGGTGTGQGGSGGGGGTGGSGTGGGANGGSGGATGTDAATPLPDAGTTGDAGDAGDPLAAARAQCVQIINMDRATLTPPSPPLTEGTAAQSACVDSQAQADFTANTPHSAFGNCSEEAQDECPNWPGPPSSIMTNCLAQMWAEGPPPAGTDNHWLNMSNAQYTTVACGFYQTPSGSWWATQDFWP